MDKQEDYDKTSAYDEGYTEGSNATYERMKGDPEKDWDTGYEYGLSKGIDEGWNAATAGHTAAKEASWEAGYAGHTLVHVMMLVIRYVHTQIIKLDTMKATILL